MRKGEERVFVDEPFERKMLPQVILPVGVLYSVLLIASVPRMLRMKPRQTLELLAFEGALLLILVALVLFFLEARRQLTLDSSRRILAAKVRWRGRTLRESRFSYDEIAALRYGLSPMQQRFVPVAGRRYPLYVVNHRGYLTRIYQGPSLPALAELSQRLGEEMEVPWESR